MSKRAIFSSAALCVGLCLFTLMAVAQAWAADVIPGQYIVVFHDNVPRPQDAAQDLSRRYGLGVLYTYEHAIKGFAARIPGAALSAIARDPRVHFISEDRVVVAFQQTLPTGVNRINAENKLNTGAGVHVAVIDTGIDLTHPDLQANIAGGQNCSTGKSYDDGNGHGTHVAGIIAALNNDIGVVGVAPGARLWAVRVLNNAGFGSWSSVICGVNFVDGKSPAKSGPITVANMSLGGSGADDGNCGLTNNDALHKAICQAVADGVTFVVAAGNSGADFRGFVPAAYNEVITVTALGDSDGRPCGAGGPTSYSADDTFASFSNYATGADLNHVIAAPGVSIYSTYKGGSYASLSGTSMASPHVAGAAALYLATHPGATPATVLGALLAAGEPVNVNFLTECLAGGVSHTDPSGNHPEPVVRADGL